MGFKEVLSLDCDNAIKLGGTDRKTGKAHETSIEGYYLGFRQVESSKAKSGFTKLHVFQIPKGTIGVWGRTDLDRKLSTASLGVMTRVTYTGMKETKNNPMYMYKVEVDSDNAIDAGALEAQNASIGEDADEETDPSDEEEALDEVPTTRAIPPKRVAEAPSAERQAKVRALLGNRQVKA